MRPPHNKSLTLLELLISIVILGLLAIGFLNLDTFTRYHVRTSDRQVKLQNDAAYILEHMTKEISRAAGDISQAPVEGTTTARIEGDVAIKVRIDYNQDGQWQDYPTDRRIAYRYRANPPNDSIYQVWYYSNCQFPNCNGQDDSPEEVLAGKITYFSATYSSQGNYVDVEITARWDPDRDYGLDNPQVTLRNRISLPAVSSH